MAELLINALVSGLLLGGFYAAVSVGVAISFGMLDIANFAQPAFIILGSYVVYALNVQFGIDPVAAGVLALPAFYLFGVALYQIYYYAFERRGDETLRGLAFFFGILFITEVGLLLTFGVDYRFVEAPYIGASLHLGLFDLPFRMLVPCVMSLVMVGGLQLFLARSFTGRAIQAVAQDAEALKLLAISPKRIKTVAFALSIATASLAGAGLIIIQPVEPFIGREYIGRVFAIVVLGGMGSFPGMLTAAMLLGVVESLTATFSGPSWSPAVAFGVLLITLAVRPAGIMGRKA